MTMKKFILISYVPSANSTIEGLKGVEVLGEFASYSEAYYFQEYKTPFGKNYCIVEEYQPIN